MVYLMTSAAQAIQCEIVGQSVNNKLERMWKKILGTILTSAWRDQRKSRKTCQDS
jgi:hypothetical protein